MLLELAGSKAEITRIRWRSADVGSWDSVSPQWRVQGARIRFRFKYRDRLYDYWIASIKQKPWGVSIYLLDTRSPLPEALDLVWQESMLEDPHRLWKIARQWLVLRFPGHQVLRASKRPDRARTLSGAFLRVLFRHGGKNGILIAAEADSADEVHFAMGQGLLWHTAFAVRSRSGHVPPLYILVPGDASAVLFHRCRLLNKDRVKAEVWEYCVDAPENPRFRRAPEPPAPKENKDFRWPVLGPFRWSARLELVLNLAPHLIRRYPKFQDYDSLRLWGLEFAQVTGPERDRVLFGVGTGRTELTEENFGDLRSLVEEILFYRRADSPDPRHPYYRLQAERWLEALVLEDIPRLFPEMAPESVYSQIPVYLGPDSGRIDILGADRHGALVVMELKVAADPDLPMQALDYWGRVIRHNENGDFERRGYFSEIRLTRRRPKIYLVSPVFSFHDTTEALLRYLEPDLEVWKISINEDWRCGVKIVRRVQHICRNLK